MKETELVYDVEIQEESLRNGSISNIEIWRVIAAVPAAPVHGKTDEIDLINGLIRSEIARKR